MDPALRVAGEMPVTRRSAPFVLASNHGQQTARKANQPQNPCAVAVEQAPCPAFPDSPLPLHLLWLPPAPLAAAPAARAPPEQTRRPPRPAHPAGTGRRPARGSANAWRCVRTGQWMCARPRALQKQRRTALPACSALSNARPAWSMPHAVTCPQIGEHVQIRAQEAEARGTEASPLAARVTAACVMAALRCARKVRPNAPTEAPAFTAAATIRPAVEWTGAPTCGAARTRPAVPVRRAAPPALAWPEPS